MYNLLFTVHEENIIWFVSALELVFYYKNTASVEYGTPRGEHIRNSRKVNTGMH